MASVLSCPDGSLGARATDGRTTLHAVAGTRTILLAFDAAAELAGGGLLGFVLSRQRGVDGPRRWLATLPPAGESADDGGVAPPEWVLRQPLQAFRWIDECDVEPGTQYLYTLTPVYESSPGTPAPAASLELAVHARPLVGADGSAVHFNRGAARALRASLSSECPACLAKHLLAALPRPACVRVRASASACVAGSILAGKGRVSPCGITPVGEDARGLRTCCPAAGRQSRVCQALQGSQAWSRRRQR